MKINRAMTGFQGKLALTLVFDTVNFTLLLKRPLLQSLPLHLFEIEYGHSRLYQALSHNGLLLAAVHARNISNNIRLNAAVDLRSQELFENSSLTRIVLNCFEPLVIWVKCLFRLGFCAYLGLECCARKKVPRLRILGQSLKLLRTGCREAWFHHSFDVSVIL